MLLANGPTDAPTLFQSLVFGHRPDPWVTLAYSFGLIATVFTGTIMLCALLGIWWERKVAAHIQSRIGPNRVGPIGLLQSIADGIKLLTKEDLCPAGADKILFLLAPYIAFAPVFAAFLAIPFGPNLVFEPRLTVGVFWILAILSLEVIGVILGGWASNNKWSVYGAMREAGQMVCYEIPLGLSIVVAIMAAGTLNLIELGHLQAGGVHTWLIFANPFVFVAFFVYFIASLASNKRAPFDLPESESELVAGYHTEYSGLRFSFFFFAEYAAMFVVSAVQVALFLGAWNDPFGLIGYYHTRFQAEQNLVGLAIVNLVGAGLFVTKAVILVFVQMWIRWTLPRPRIDQVLYACIKVLLPLGCVLLLGAALWQLLIPGQPGTPWTSITPLNGEMFNPWKLSHWLKADAAGALWTQALLAIAGIGGFGLIIAWVIKSAIQVRDIVQRLTEPDPIPNP